MKNSLVFLGLIISIHVSAQCHVGKTKKEVTEINAKQGLVFVKSRMDTLFTSMLDMTQEQYTKLVQTKKVRKDKKGREYVEVHESLVYRHPKENYEYRYDFSEEEKCMNTIITISGQEARDKLMKQLGADPNDKKADAIKQLAEGKTFTWFMNSFTPGNYIFSCTYP